MNRTTLLPPIALILLIGCATSAVQTNPQSTANAQLVSILPPAGSAVNADTTLVAEVDYTIENFDPTARYYVAPLFDSTEGPGRTFTFTSPTSGPRLRSASGRVRIVHPIRLEWSHRSLAKPVRVTFFVTVRAGSKRTKVIGKTETVQFRPAA